MGYSIIIRGIGDNWDVIPTILFTPTFFELDVEATIVKSRNNPNSFMVKDTHNRFSPTGDFSNTVNNTVGRLKHHFYVPANTRINISPNNMDIFYIEVHDSTFKPVFGGEFIYPIDISINKSSELVDIEYRRSFSTPNLTIENI